MKGYTLIELLATIVILAVIMIIAVPIVNNVLKYARKEVFRSSSFNIAKSGEYAFANQYFFKDMNAELIFTYTDGVESSNVEGLSLEFNGEKPLFGNVVVSSDGKTAVSLHDGEFCSTKEFYDKKVKVTEVVKEECIREMHLPTISLIGNKELTIEINTAYVEEGYVALTTLGDIATDVVRKVFFNSTEVSDVDVSKLGTYIITYQVLENGKMNVITRTVNVVDTVAPQLLIPEFTPLTIGELASFNIVSSIGVIDNSLETIAPEASGSIAKIPGTYFITISATDSSGNSSERIVSINVIDVEAPVITLNGSSVIDMFYGETYTELGATAMDDSDLNVTSSIVITGAVNTSSVGTYFIIYTVTDSSGNESSRTRTVNVNDNIAPTVNFSINGNTVYGKARNTVVSATDAHSGVASLYYLWTTSATAPAGSSINNIFTNGATINTPALVTGGYYLWIKAIDHAANTNIIRSNVFNLDNTAPVITLVGPASTSINLGTAYADPGVTALDNINGNISASVVRTGSINQNVSGTYTLYYNVTDASGNVATQVTRTVVVNSRTEYRYRDLYESCDTCYQTCSNNQGAASSTNYSCPGGYTLNGTTCNASYNVYSTISRTYTCSSGSWSMTSSSCSGNCNAPCAGGYSGGTGGETSNNCPSGSCSTNGATRSCTSEWYGTCSSSVGASSSTTYSCPGGWTLNGSTCYSYYNCNPYSCNCSSYWGGWSSWSSTVYTASGSRQVETRQVTSI